MKGIASTALKSLRQPELLEHRAFLDGNWVERPTGLSVTDPATGDILGDVAACSTQDADNAVEVVRILVEASESLMEQSFVR